MANEEHVAIFKQGMDVWNKWREANPTVEPDLSGADLSWVFSLAGRMPLGLFNGANFRGANLREANFSSMDLSGAIFREADLNGAYLLKTKFKGADLYKTSFYIAEAAEADFRDADLRGVDFTRTGLRGAYLSEVDLSGVKLNGANLMQADLTQADLTEANLIETDFRGAELTEVVIKNAEMGRTILANLDLSSVKGLETVKHLTRSYLDVTTLEKSRGKIPEVFLRGIGWSDEYIEFVFPLYKNKVIQYYSGFISYSSDDEEFARRLYNDLQAAGVRVWFAPEDLKIGDEFGKMINREIRLRDKLILVLSESSVNSDWVAFEVDKAFKEEKERNAKKEKDEPVDPVLFPITIDNAVFDSDEQWAFKIQKNRHIGDLRRWKNHDKYQKGLERLLRDLKGGK